MALTRFKSIVSKLGNLQRSSSGACFRAFATSTPQPQKSVGKPLAPFTNLKVGASAIGFYDDDIPSPKRTISAAKHEPKDDVKKYIPESHCRGTSGYDESDDEESFKCRM